MKEGKWIAKIRKPVIWWNPWTWFARWETIAEADDLEGMHSKIKDYWSEQA